jgi:hypothetical protein
LSPALITTQPPTKTVEVVEGAHPVEKGLVFDKVIENTNEK